VQRERGGEGRVRQRGKERGGGKERGQRKGPPKAGTWGSRGVNPALLTGYNVTLLMGDNTRNWLNSCQIGMGIDIS
jgi:hypothetical protein